MSISIQSLIRFSLVGISNTLLGLGVIYIAWDVFGIGDITANILGYVTGFIWGYMWNRSWTFSAPSKSIHSFWRYAFICVLAYSANLATLGILRNMLGSSSFLPHVAGALVYAGLSYVGSCYFAFSSSRLPNETQ